MEARDRERREEPRGGAVVGVRLAGEAGDHVAGHGDPVDAVAELLDRPPDLGGTIGAPHRGENLVRPALD